MRARQNRGLGRCLLTDSPKAAPPPPLNSSAESRRTRVIDHQNPPISRSTVEPLRQRASSTAAAAQPNRPTASRQRRRQWTIGSRSAAAQHGGCASSASRLISNCIQAAAAGWKAGLESRGFSNRPARWARRRSGRPCHTGWSLHRAPDRRKVWRRGLRRMFLCGGGWGESVCGCDCGENVGRAVVVVVVVVGGAMLRGRQPAGSEVRARESEHINENVRHKWMKRGENAGGLLTAVAQAALEGAARAHDGLDLPAAGVEVHRVRAAVAAGQQR